MLIFLFPILDATVAAYEYKNKNQNDYDSDSSLFALIRTWTVISYAFKVHKVGFVETGTAVAIIGGSVIAVTTA